MYADAVTFKIRSISGPRVEMAETAAVVHQHDFTDEFDPSDLPVERIYDAMEAAFYDHMGPFDGVAFRVEYGYFSQGADGAAVTFLIDLMEGLREEAWGTLFSIAVEEIIRAALSNSDDSDDDPPPPPPPSPA